MKAHRHKPAEIEGLLVVEFVNESGRLSVGIRSDAQVSKLSTPPPCPKDDDEKQTFAVAGRIKGGLLWREGATRGEPLLPFGIYVEGKD